jgi:hypothetical protein
MNGWCHAFHTDAWIVRKVIGEIRQTNHHRAVWIEVQSTTDVIRQMIGHPDLAEPGRLLARS